MLRPSANEALEAYAALVRAHREQVLRLAEQPPSGDDFWRARVDSFRPGGLEIEEWELVRALTAPDQVWLDIGAGAGRFVVPLSSRVGRVVAIEPSAAMREALLEVSSQLPNVEVLDLRWPPAGGTGPTGDVALAANVLYDSTELGPFLAGMERHARLCVVIVSDQAPRTPDPLIWEALFGEPLRPLPALREFLAVLGAAGQRYEVQTVTAAPVPPVELEVGHAQMRWRFGLTEGSDRDRALRELLIGRFGLADGRLALPPRRNFTAVVSWSAPAA